MSLILDEATNIGHSVGQCRFQYVDTTTCKLVPYNGNLIKIGTTWRKIPDSGVTLSSTSVPVFTDYYITAMWVDNTIVLDPLAVSLNTPTVQNGVTGFYGGATPRTLVGMVRTGSGPVFINTSANRLVISWFNRMKAHVAAGSGGGTTTSTSFVANGGTAYFLSWGDKDIDVTTSGKATNSLATGATISIPALNGAAINHVGGAYPQGGPGAASSYYPHSLTSCGTPVVGLNSISQMIAVAGGGTGTFVLQTTAVVDI